MPPDQQIHRRTRLHSVEVASLQVLFFFVLPITLLYFHIIPLGWRVPVLLVFSLLIYGVIKKEGWTNRDMGLTLTNFKEAFPTYLTATAVASIVVIVFAHMLHMTPVSDWWTKPHFLYLFLVVSFFQEFAFRGFLMPILGRVFPDAFTIVLVNALLFSGMHAIYPIPAVGLPFSFVAGLFFATLYRRYPNLLLVSACHAILNFMVVWYGFFTIPH